MNSAMTNRDVARMLLENVEPITDVPTFFQSTQYRLPNIDEVKSILRNNMSPRELLNKIGYTIIGKGKVSAQTKATMLEFANLLSRSSTEPKYAELVKLMQEYVRKD